MAMLCFLKMLHVLWLARTTNNAKAAKGGDNAGEKLCYRRKKSKKEGVLLAFNWSALPG
jgi:hypothetical protein